MHRRYVYKTERHPFLYYCLSERIPVTQIPQGGQYFWMNQPRCQAKCIGGLPPESQGLLSRGPDMPFTRQLHAGKNGFNLYYINWIGFSKPMRNNHFARESTETPPGAHFFSASEQGYLSQAVRKQIPAYWARGRRRPDDAPSHRGNPPETLILMQGSRTSPHVRNVSRDGRQATGQS